VGYLFAAYAVIWIALFLYLLSLSRRNRELEEEVRDLRRLLER
jgi:CcmD family protein